VRQPGRKSSFSTFSITGAAPRLRPSAELGPLEQRVFLDIVASCQPEHFRESDRPLLESYVRNVVLEKSAFAEYTREPVLADGTASPWKAVQTDARRALVDSSLRLRLAPQARQKVSTKAEPQLSYYERVALMESGEDDEVPTEN
jgi:hypothetical protein